MLKRKVLIFKLVAVDRLAATSVTRGKVAALDHLPITPINVELASLDR